MDLSHHYNNKEQRAFHNMFWKYFSDTSPMIKSVLLDFYFNSISRNTNISLDIELHTDNRMPIREKLITYVF